MDLSLFLTIFLLLGGLFTLCCAIKNFEWFMAMGWVLVKTFGRPATRAFYILVGMVMLVFGITRVINPPPSIEPEFIFNLAQPEKINLTQGTQTITALEKANSVKQLIKTETDWVRFSSMLPRTHPDYESAAASSVAGIDFSEGFAINQKLVDGDIVTGRILYFDSMLQSCDNILFSKKPLKSAAWVVVINAPKNSKQRGIEEGLLIEYFRSGTPQYQQVTAF